jgi:hypothetical protein
VKTFLYAVLGLALASAASFADAATLRINHLAGGYEEYYGAFLQLNMETGCSGSGGVEFYFTDRVEGSGPIKTRVAPTYSGPSKGCYVNWEISLSSDETGYFYEQWPCVGFYQLSSETLTLTCTTY